MSLPLIRVGALRAVGGFDPATVPCDDWDLWLRMARIYKFGSVPDELVLYTRHAAQQSNDVLRMARATQRTLIKQWPHVVTKPNSLRRLVVQSEFLKSLPCYLVAKQSLFASERRRAWATLGYIALRWPLAFYTRQWIYLMRRLLTNDTSVY